MRRKKEIVTAFSPIFHQGGLETFWRRVDMVSSIFLPLIVVSSLKVCFRFLAVVSSVTSAVSRLSKQSPGSCFLTDVSEYSSLIKSFNSLYILSYFSSETDRLFRVPGPSGGFWALFYAFGILDQHIQLLGGTKSNLVHTWFNSSNISHFHHLS